MIKTVKHPSPLFMQTIQFNSIKWIRIALINFFYRRPGRRRFTVQDKFPVTTD